MEEKLNLCGCGGTPGVWTADSIYHRGFTCVFVICDGCGSQTTREVFRPKSHNFPVLDKHIYKSGDKEGEKRARAAAVGYWNTHTRAGDSDEQR